MPHITIDGWEYRDGYVSPLMALENKRRFTYLRRAMATGMSEKQATADYDAKWPPPRKGQAHCPDCGCWTCEAPHE